MEELALGRFLPAEGFEVHQLGWMTLHLTVASLLAAFAAYRPWRRLLQHAPLPRPEAAQSQTLIAVAAALMVAVIGNSTARAFGLVGLGAFMRFRAGIKDQRDAAALFVMIGIGMACGRGMLLMGALAAAMFSAALLVFDLTSKPQLRSLRVVFTLDEAAAAFPSILSAFPDARVLEVPQFHPGPGRVVLQIQASPELDAVGMLETLQNGGVGGVVKLAIESDDVRA